MRPYISWNSVVGRPPSSKTSVKVHQESTSVVPRQGHKEETKRRKKEEGRRRKRKEEEGRGRRRRR
jgi:hypothetical protein